VENLAGANPLKGTILISPRTHQWQEQLDLQDSVIPVIMAKASPGFTGNAGIVAFDITRSGPGTYDIFVQVASGGFEETQVTLRLSQRKGPVSTIHLPLDQNGSSRIELESVPLNPGELLVELMVDDLLDLDNRATATISPRTEPLFVRFEKQVRPFIQSAVLADKRIIAVQSERITPPGRTIRIIDGSYPDSGDTGPALVIFPTSDFSGFPFNRLWASPMKTSFDPVHPITRNVRFHDLRPAKISEYSIPEGFQILGRAEKIPIIMVGEADQGRMVVWGFDPEDNGIYLDPSFPILAHESIRWLADDSYGISRRDYGCVGEGYSAAPGERQNGNILCKELTVQSGEITLPYLPEVVPSNLPGSTPVRTDLAPQCFILAIVILSLLAINSAFDLRGD